MLAQEYTSRQTSAQAIEKKYTSHHSVVFTVSGVLGNHVLTLGPKKMLGKCNDFSLTVD